MKSDDGMPLGLLSLLQCSVRACVLSSMHCSTETMSSQFQLYMITDAVHLLFTVVALCTVGPKNCTIFSQ